jgi:hypothetical protein
VRLSALCRRDEDAQACRAAFEEEWRDGQRLSSPPTLPMASVPSARSHSSLMAFTPRPSALSK